MLIGVVEKIVITVASILNALEDPSRTEE